LSTEVAGGGDEPSGGTVIDFMEALRRSTGKSKEKPAGGRAKTAASRQKREPTKRSPPKTAKRKARSR
jgi:DNA end-binding protein Ku